MLLWQRHWNKDEIGPQTSAPGATQPEAPSQALGLTTQHSRGFFAFTFLPKKENPTKAGMALVTFTHVTALRLSIKSAGCHAGLHALPSVTAGMLPQASLGATDLG